MNMAIQNIKTLSEEKKRFILGVLEKDYIPITDGVSETCADTYADMFMSGALKTEEGKADKLLLQNLKKQFYDLIRVRKFPDVLPIIEQINTLQNKYQLVRRGRGNGI